MFMVSLGLLGLFGIGLLGVWTLLWRTPQNSSSTPSSKNYARNLLDSGTKLPNEGEMTNAGKASVRAANLLGIGAAAQGDGHILIVAPLLADQARSGRSPR